MLDHASLSPEALAYFQSCPLGAQVAMNHSALTLRTLEDLRRFEAWSLSSLDGRLRQSGSGPEEKV